MKTKILKILGFCICAAIIAVGTFYGYQYATEEIVIIDGVNHNKAIKLNPDVAVIQKLSNSDIKLKEIQVQFGTYRKTKIGVLTVSLLENGKTVQQWLFEAEKLIDNAYQPFTLEKPIKLNLENNYAIKISYHYNANDDNVIAVWSNDDAQYGSFKNGEQTLNGSICYKLVYLE